MELNGKIHHKSFLSDKLGFNKTIFEENGELISLLKGINLSGGYPEWDTPIFVKEALANATFKVNENHYSQCAGHPDLQKAIATAFKTTFLQDLDPEKNIIIGEGGSGLIFLVFFSLIQPGDEIIIIEPFFQHFYFNAKMAGATLKFCEMIPKNSEWTLDFEKLEGLFSAKTKLIIINSPHNPTGKVFSKEELLRIREILLKFPNVLVLADEVYEKCVFDKTDFPRIASFENMWKRTITIMSAGKTFNVTGWRIGYAIAHESLINSLVAAQRVTVFCNNKPCSAAVSKMIPQGNEPFNEYPSYYSYHNSMLQISKDLLIKGFSQIPQITIFPPKGGYFFIIAIDGLIKYIPKQYFYKNDVKDLGSQPLGFGYEELENPDYTPSQACFYWLAKEIGVHIIPLDSFYENEGRLVKEFKGRNLLRVSVCVKPSSIEAALQKLQKALTSLNN